MEAETATKSEQAKVDLHGANIIAAIKASGVEFVLSVPDIVTSKGLAGVRRYAIVGVFVVAAVVTPPDVFSQLSLAIPLVGLYELSILSVKFIEKQRAAEEAKAAAGA